MTRTSSIAALALCLLPSFVLAGKVIERPGVRYTPAFVCIATTVRPDGHTYMSSVIRSSGNRRSDRFALRLARNTKFVAPEGQELGEQWLRERQAHLLYRVHSNFTFAFRLFELDEPLPPICHSPYESVARDAEINAATEM